MNAGALVALMGRVRRRHKCREERQAVRRNETRPYTCADLEWHADGQCETRKHGHVKAEGLVMQCPRCGEVFMAADSHCLQSKHRRCHQRLRMEQTGR